MEKVREKVPIIRWVQLRVTERFQNVLFPVDIALLLRSLPQIGYIVSRKVFKGVLEPGEPLATKGNVELIINSANNLLGVEGRDVSELLGSFNELRKFWLEELKPSPEPQTFFAELYGQGVVKSVKNPNGVFTDFWASYEKVQKLSKIVGYDITNFGLRLTPKRIDPNNPDWFDLTLSPHVISSTSHYFLNIVWRDRKLEDALKKFKTTEDVIDSVIKEVER